MPSPSQGRDLLPGSENQMSDYLLGGVVVHLGVCGYVAAAPNFGVGSQTNKEKAMDDVIDVPFSASQRAEQVSMKAVDGCCSCALRLRMALHARARRGDEITEAVVGEEVSRLNPGINPDTLALIIQLIMAFLAMKA